MNMGIANHHRTRAETNRRLSMHQAGSIDVAHAHVQVCASMDDMGDEEKKQKISSLVSVSWAVTFDLDSACV